MRGRKATGWWGVVLDARDPKELAEFYARLLDWRIATDEPTWVVIAPPDGVTYIGFHLSEKHVRPVWPPVDGEQQMQLHLDFEVGDLDAAVADAIEMGAELAEFQPQTDVRVMLDPVGHPFCLYHGSDG